MVALLMLGLTACMQGGLFSDPPTDAADSTATVGNTNFKHTQSHDHNWHVSSAAGLSNSADPPPDFVQIPGTGGSLWERIQINFQLPAAANRPQVQAQINWFVHNQSYLDRTIKRAAPYMYLIFQETQTRNLPAELVLLPIMESAYNPFIRSSRGAVGLWQLMASTANGFGVKQDFWYDGRRDVYASTNAALDYLTYLQSYFGGDWLLAIAAYDAGEGRLQNAVHHNAERGLSTDFWSLSLPVETRAYVPRLLALAAIIQNPDKYNIVLPPITDQPYLQQVDLGAPINLSQAAGMAGMSLAALKALNPGYSRTSTGPNGPYRLLLPIDRIPMFKERLAAMPAMIKTTWGRYKVQHGDTLSSISDRFDSSVTELRNVNQLKSTSAPVGHVIMIPLNRTPVIPHIDDIATGKQTSLTADNVVEHAVNVAASQAPTTNNMGNNGTSATTTASAVTASTNESNTTAVKVSVDNDQDDEIANNSTKQATLPHTINTAETTYHVIKRGETLSTIARRYDVKIAGIQLWNKLKTAKVLKPGTRLTIYPSAAAEGDTDKNTAAIKGSVPVRAKLVTVSKTNKTIAEQPSSSAAKITRYTVRAGDNLIKIAERYNVKVTSLRRWNHLAENAIVRPGQKLVIYTQ